MITKERTYGLLMDARDFAFAMAMQHNAQCFAQAASAEQYAHESAQAERWTVLFKAACRLLDKQRTLWAAP